MRKVAQNVTALEVSIEAEPGEYAFVIRDPKVEEYFKHIGDDEKMRPIVKDFRTLIFLY